MTISNGSSNDGNDILNIYQHGGNVLQGRNGTVFIPVIINNASGVRNVYLYVYGKATGAGLTSSVHGVSRHYHGFLGIKAVTGNTRISTQSGSSGADDEYHTITSGDNGTNDGQIGDPNTSLSLAYTNVPKTVKIYVDGVDKTSTIGDPNGKGATKYDSGSQSWGVNGSTIWDTGRLDLTSVITWTAGEHRIELVESGGFGGVLIYHCAVNTGA